MSKNTVNLNSKSMEEYLSKFDVLNHKYFYWLKEGAETDNELLHEISKLKSKIWKEWYQYGKVVKWDVKNSIDTYLTLDKVYGNKGSESRECAIVQCTIEKFLRDYVNIPGVNKLFDSKYFGFEWGMHTEYKDKSKQYSYYRDHYVHQIRNMYEMLVLLDEFKFDVLCKDLYSRNKNRMGKYIWNSVEEEVRHMPQTDRELFQSIYAIYPDKQAQEESDEFIKDILFRETIYSAAILAALIHDIGYPITYMSRVADQLQDFIPITRDFIDVRMNITHVYSELQQSILFQIIPYEMIEKKLQAKDHGALSAIILLKYFYNKGFIRELTPTKKMAIELAAVIIFFHTLKYNIHGEKGFDFEQPIFYKDPLSYLFRLCDDIQEWDRVYFEISKNRNYFMCKECNTMFYFDSKKKEYSCCCGKNAGYNITSFYYRRIIHVSTSESARLIYEEKQNYLKIIIKYDLFQLLLVSHYNNKFAKIRADELKKIKQELNGQRYFPRTFVECIVTANPILLKIKILEFFIDKYIGYNGKQISDFLKREMDIENIKEILEIYKDKKSLKQILQPIKSQITKKCRKLNEKKEFETVFKKKEQNAEWIRKKLIVNKIDFYLRLLLVGKLMRNIKEKLSKIELHMIIKELCEGGYLGEWDLTSAALQYLCEDYLWQTINEVTEEEFESKNMKGYNNMYIQSDFLCDEVSCYTEYSEYSVVRDNSVGKSYGVGKNIPIDFYSDLYMFYELNEYLKEDKKKEDK